MSRYDSDVTDRQMRDVGPLLEKEQTAELANLLVKETMTAISRQEALDIANNISDNAGMIGAHLQNVVMAALFNIKGLKPEILAKKIIPVLEKAIEARDKKPAQKGPKNAAPNAAKPSSTNPKPS